MRKVNRILVPVKGHSTDAEAISLAGSIAKRDKSTVIAIYVIEVKRALPLDIENDEEVERGEALLSRAEALAKGMDFKLETDLLQARDVGPAIVDDAIQREADLVILGTTYKRRYGEFSLGKVVPYVLEHAPCEVWVMRAPKVTDDAKQ